MLDRIRLFFSKWYVKLVIIVLTFLLGFVGFYVQYRTEPPSLYAFAQTVYSAIRLFGMAVDKAAPVQTTFQWYEVLIEIAKWLALLIVVPAVFKLLRPLLTSGKEAARFRVWKHRKTKVLLIGDNGENRQILQSVSPAENGMLIADDRKSEETEDAYHTDALALIRDQITGFFRRPHETVTVVINTGDEQRNLQLCREAIDAVEAFVTEKVKTVSGEAQHSAADPSAPRFTRRRLSAEKQLVSWFERLRIIVFGRPEYEDLYLNLQKKSYGFMQYTNKYTEAAQRFVVQHPLTEFLPARHIPVEAGCVPNDLRMNVIMIGFGDTNQQLYSVCRATNQFISRRPDGIPGPQMVTYHIMDCRKAESIVLNHKDFRYELLFRREGASRPTADAYYPLPEAPAETVFHCMDYHAPEFMAWLQRTLRTDEHAINYIMIAVGDDLSNIDLAHKCLECCQLWEHTNTYIFPKIRDRLNEQNVLIPHAKLIPFGNESHEIFSVDQILHNERMIMAKQRNLIYQMDGMDSELEKGSITEEDAKIHADYDWYRMKADRRLSNTYAILSLRFRLQLIGMDYTKQAPRGREIRTEKEYMDIYARGDDLQVQGRTFRGRPLVKYRYDETADDFRKGILRKNMAVQEHYRWNAYMISRGYLPAAMNSPVQRDYERRTHCNLATFEGLFRYRDGMEYCGRDPEDSDVIHYDYQLLDGAWELLHEAGYHLIRR